MIKSRTIVDNQVALSIIQIAQILTGDEVDFKIIIIEFFNKLTHVKNST